MATFQTARGTERVPALETTVMASAGSPTVTTIQPSPRHATPLLNRAAHPKGEAAAGENTKSCPVSTAVAHGLGAPESWGHDSPCNSSAHG